MSLSKRTRADNKKFDLNLNDILNPDITFIIIEFILQPNFNKTKNNLSFKVISKNILKYFQQSSSFNINIFSKMYYLFLPKNTNLKIKISLNEDINKYTPIYGLKFDGLQELNYLSREQLIKKVDLESYFPKKLTLKNFIFISSSINKFESCYDLLNLDGHIYIRNMIFQQRVNIEKNSCIKFINCIFYDGLSSSLEVNISFIKCTFYSSNDKLSTIFISNDSRVEIILCHFLKSVNIKKDSAHYLYIENPLLLRINKTTFEEHHNTTRHSSYIKINENILNSKLLDLISIQKCSFINNTQKRKNAIIFNGSVNYDYILYRYQKFIIKNNLFVNSNFVFNISLKREIRTKGIIFIIENKWASNIRNMKCFILKGFGNFMIKKCILNNEDMSNKHYKIIDTSIIL